MITTIARLISIINYFSLYSIYWSIIFSCAILMIFNLKNWLRSTSSSNTWCRRRRMGTRIAITTIRNDITTIKIKYQIGFINFASCHINNFDISTLTIRANNCIAVKSKSSVRITRFSKYFSVRHRCFNRMIAQRSFHTKTCFSECWSYRSLCWGKTCTCVS